MSTIESSNDVKNASANKSTATEYLPGIKTCWSEKRAINE